MTVIPNRAGILSGLVGLLLGFELVLGTAQAAPTKWRDQAYRYVVVNQSVADVLTNFGFNTGLRMAIAPEVSGVVRGRIDAATAGKFLDTVTRSNALDWYYDGSVMYVSPASAEMTVMVALHGASFAAIKETVAGSGLLDERYAFSVGEHGAPSDFVVVAGPPSYVAVIKRTVEAAAARADGPTIYRGSQSASAGFHEK